MANNAQRWASMHIPAAYGPEFQKVSDTLKKYKARYEVVVKRLADMGHPGMPWEFVAVTHYREAGFNNQGQPRFDRYLGNGQVLSKKTTIVPAGRGPWGGPTAWEDGAVDALLYAPPKAALNKDWSIGGTLNKLEEYNGLGYRYKGLPSPYLWARTDQYDKGKYVADGVYDPNHVDTQLGVAGILKFLGYGKTNSGAVIGGAAAGAAGVGALAAFWDHIMAHWVAYGTTAIIVGGLIALMVYAHNHKDDNVQ